jgi:tetratricopeptide (TPR) repeat protein
MKRGAWFRAAVALAALVCLAVLFRAAFFRGGREATAPPQAVIHPKPAPASPMGVTREEALALARSLGLDDSSADLFFSVIRKSGIAREEEAVAMREFLECWKGVSDRLDAFPWDEYPAISHNMARDIGAALKRGDVDNASFMMAEADRLRAEADAVMGDIMERRWIVAAIRKGEEWPMRFARGPAHEDNWAIARQSPVVIERDMDGSDPDIVRKLSNLGMIYYSRRNFSDAEQVYLRALDIQKRFSRPGLASLQNNLAVLYDAMGRPAEAEPLFRRALTAVVDKNSLDTSTIMNNMAVVCEELGRRGDAEFYYRWALDLREKNLGGNHPFVAASLDNLAALLEADGRLADAEQLYGRALSIRRKSLGPDHPYVATSMNNLGMLYYGQGRYDKAEPHLKRSLAIRERILGVNNPALIDTLNNLALTYEMRKRYDEAEPLYRRALRIAEKIPGAKYQDVARSINNLAMLYRNQGQNDRAAPLYRKALKYAESTFPPHASPPRAGNGDNNGVKSGGSGEDGKADRNP